MFANIVINRNNKLLCVNVAELDGFSKMKFLAKNFTTAKYLMEGVWEKCQVLDINGK